MEIQFKRRITVTNSKYIKLKNIDRIVAVNTQPCRTVHGVPGIIPGEYFEKWVIKKEPAGYIFREVKHNMGICGHAKTLRRLIIQSSGLSHIKIIFNQ